jgi:restriction system protein
MKLFCIVFAIALVIFILVRVIIHRRRGEMWYIDRMEGLEFEEYLVELYRAYGYEVEPTPASGDFGADLIVYSGSEKLIIQAKRYNHKVGVEAVQQVAAAVPFYKGTRGIVITNSYYTENARRLAAPNRVELVDRDGLKELIDGLP